MTLLKFCTDSQKQKFLVPQATGKALAAFGLTEPEAGRDAAAIQSTARRDSGGCYILNGQGKRDTREVSLAKWHATESAFAAADDALQLQGNKGFSDDESPIGRYFRNARALIIYEGTTQIHKMMQAEHTLGYRALNGPEERVVSNQRR